MATTSPAPKKASPAAKKAPRPPSNHPSTLKMVTDAIDALKEPKGVSAVTIKLYICEKYKDINPNSLRPRLRQALTKGLDQGVIAKSKSTEEKPVLMSRYRLLKQKAEKKPKEKKTETKKATEKTKTVEKKTKKTTEKKTTKTTPKKKATKAAEKKPAKVKAKTPVKKTAKPKGVKGAPKTPKTPKRTKSKK